MDAAPRVRVEDYLALEAQSETKHEYLNGIVYAMAGASIRHNLIAGNIARHLGNALADRPCIVLPSDQRVRIDETGSYAYPDVTVVCDRPRLTGERPPSLENPTLLVEVLSSSTWMHDLSLKLAHYRRIASVQHVLFVGTEEQQVLHYRRAENAWILTDHQGDDAIELAALAVALPLREVYAKVDSLPADA